MLPTVTPMPLSQQAIPFNDPDWLFEVTPSKRVPTYLKYHKCEPRVVMNWQHLLVFGALANLSTASNVQAQSPYFSGFYSGFEGGAISHHKAI